MTAEGGGGVLDGLKKNLPQVISEIPGLSWREVKHQNPTVEFSPMLGVVRTKLTACSQDSIANFWILIPLSCFKFKYSNISLPNLEVNLNKAWAWELIDCSVGKNRKFCISRVRPSTLSTCPPIHLHVMQKMVMSPRRQVPVIVSCHHCPALCLLPSIPTISSRVSIFLDVLCVSFLPTFPWYVTPFYLKAFEGWPVRQVLIVIFNTSPPFHYALVEVTLHLRPRTQCCLPDVQGWLLGQLHIDDACTPGLSQGSFIIVLEYTTDSCIDYLAFVSWSP